MTDQASLSASHLPTNITRAFIGVVSRGHVMRGVAGGFAQVCHGKQAPLQRMKAGDWFIYYSPATEMRGGEPLRAFTAIGRVHERSAYQVDLGEGFTPYRRDIDYVPGARQVPLSALAHALHFARPGSNWGMLARRGHFEIDQHDLSLIARAMGASLAH